MKAECVGCEKKIEIEDGKGTSGKEPVYIPIPFCDECLDDIAEYFNKKHLYVIH